MTPSKFKTESVSKGASVKSIIDFLKESNSNLLDFVGFSELEEMEQEPIF